MTEVTGHTPTKEIPDTQTVLEKFEGSPQEHGPVGRKFFIFFALSWAIFQLWIASPFPFLINFGIVVDVPARAIHLGFAFLLCFIVFPKTKVNKTIRIHIVDVLLGFAACLCALYPFIAQEGITKRVGVLLKIDVFGVSVPIEAIIGGLGILFLMNGR